jgi:two-component system cell cycle sensor histidine kinase/response regulator CckA
MHKIDYKQAKIMLVDDEPINLYLLEEILRKHGYQHLEVCQDSTQAMAVWQRFQPDLLLLDLWMPEVDGFAIMHQLRQAVPSDEFMPIIVVSRDVTPESKQRSLEAGARHFINNPLDMIEFLLMVHNLLETRFLHQALREKNAQLQSQYRERSRELRDEISEHQRTEVARQRSESRARSIFEAAANAIVLLSPQGSVLDWNPAASLSHGCSLESVRGQNYLERFLSPEAAAHMERSWLELLRGIQPEPFEGEIQGPEGTRLTFRWTLSALEPNTSQASLLLIGQDMTAYKQLEEQIRHNQKMDAVGRLASGIAHDFNNFLTVMIGYSDLILSTVDSASPVHRFTQEISKAAFLSSSLIRHLQDFSRQTSVELKDIYLHLMLRNLHGAMKRLLADSSRLVLQTARDLPPIEADPAQIEQVIMNLVCNARDAVNKTNGGTVSLMVHSLTPEEKQAAAVFLPDRERDYVRLSVEDTGCGMPQEILPQIFEPFFSTRRDSKGAGLGLSTVYGVVRHAGGCVQVHSEVGKGSRFDVYLPVSQTHAEQGFFQLRQTDIFRNVLLIEEEALLRDLIGQSLELQGFKVTAFGSAAEALAALRGLEEPIDLLVTDVGLPHSTEADCIAQLCGLYPDIKVVYMYGHSEAPLDDYGLHPDLPGLIRKPFTLSQLQQLIQTLLEVPDDPGLVG